MAIFLIIFDAMLYIQIHPAAATHEGTAAVAYRGGGLDLMQY